MAIIGIGMDIVQISRIEKSISRNGDHLARYILSNNELSIWEAHKRSVRFLAKRFTVKEATAKAFGIGMRRGLAFNQFEVFNDELGKPYLRLQGKALCFAKQLGIMYIHVTLADERSYACSTVIIEN